MKESLIQVKEDSHIKFLMNLTSFKGGKQSASTASTSGRGKGSSSYLSSLKSSSWGSRGTKRPFSSSPSPRLKVSFTPGILRFPTPKKSFSK